eukprot:TRINITY_DN774114_c0_g1_i1.p1 TRINITY_DN774114_c0_g1~~TRINITY_DN774114_c0_g1_i1.p1  ORF type:complete len:315 (+),score=44.32 TRINITY_DN774114_c0_g1_i1:72-947(+)
MTNKCLSPKEKTHKKKEQSKFDIKSKNKMELVRFDDAPQYLQYNPFIQIGYRPTYSMKHCMISWFGLHNESWNIWTHMFGAVLGFVLSYQELTNEDFSYVRTISALVQFIVFILSITYHTFMPSCRDQKEYNRLLKLDVLGVVTSMSITGMLILLYGNKCTPDWVRTGSVVLFTLSTLFGYFVAIFSKNNKERAKGISIHILIRIFCGFGVLIPKVFNHSAESFFYHAISTAFIVGGGMINSSRFPEKKFPLKFDNGLSSHVIWHIFVIIAGYLCHVGVGIDESDFNSMKC